MFVQSLKKYNPAVIVVIIIFSIILWLPLFLGNNPNPFFAADFKMPLYLLTIDVINTFNFSYFYLIFTALLILIQIFLILRLDLKYSALGNKTLLTSFFFLFFSVGLIRNNFLHPVIISNLFLILALFYIFDSVTRDKALNNFFNASLLIAIGSLFYFNFIFLIFFVIISIFIIRSRITKEIITAILGFITVYIIFFLIYYLITGNIFELFEIIKNQLVINKKNYDFSLNEIILLCSLAFFILIISLNIVARFSQKKIVKRIYFKILFILFSSVILIYFIIPSVFLELSIIFSIPLSFLFSDFFIKTKSKWLANILLILFVAVIVFNQYYHIFF